MHLLWGTKIANQRNCKQTNRDGLSSQKDIYSFLRSPQMEKEKNGIMDINLRSIAVVASLGGCLTSLRNLCMHFYFPQPEHSYQSYLKYLEKLTQEVKKEDCIGHVQERLGTALRRYNNKRWGAILSDGKGTGGKDV